MIEEYESFTLARRQPRNTDFHKGSLQKMLIRDAKAAARCVQVGAFSDPQEAEGLAHYLEHMVFMGSQSTQVRMVMIL